MLILIFSQVAETSTLPLAMPTDLELVVSPQLSIFANCCTFVKFIILIPDFLLVGNCVPSSKDGLKSFQVVTYDNDDGGAACPPGTRTAAPSHFPAPTG